MLYDGGLGMSCGNRFAARAIAASNSGELLFLGNALSGSVTPLADTGFRVTVLDF